MKLEIKSFRTKVARRIFTLFMICAILPISALAWISFSHVKKQLYGQSQERLHQESKSIIVSIYERLCFLRSDMKMMASNFESYFKNPGPALSQAPGEKLLQRFSGFALLTDKGYTSLFGDIENPLELTLVEKQHLNSGKALLRHQLNPGHQPLIFIGMALDPDQPGRGILLGKINTSYLWEAADGKSPLAEICVLDHSNNILFTSLLGLRSFPEQYFAEMTNPHKGQFEWRHNAKKYFAKFSSIFLEPNFLYPKWIVVLSESNEDILAPMSNFKKSFPALIVLSLGMVFFLSMSLIRKSMVPIETLRTATHKISKGAFGHKVEITSGDEFESLGNSFNEMSEKLEEGQILLVQAAKMSTMGQMAAGIVHEINQPLSAIHGHLQLILMDAPSGKDRKRLEIVMGAVERLNGILGRFRLFLRMPSKELMRNLSIVDVIDQVNNLMGHQFDMKQIRFIKENEENLPSILGDKQALEQVISNLLINAVQALEDKKKDQRIINIRTYSFEDRVFLEVEDTGCGMPAETQERIFDPFFTTKDPEKGTGLGMTIVESILHKHNGKIKVESNVGVGTKFTLVFPASPEKERT